jgi:FKBP-type peptidyl-prolyl cis-trans isomerase SlyD
VRIAAGTAVTLEYALRAADEPAPIDWTDPGEPLTFLFGTGRVLPGLEHLLFGLEPGTSIEGEIAPEDAYGYRDEALVELVPRDRFGPAGPPELGAHFESRADGRVRFAKVVGFEGDDVRLDLNHPLAGSALFVTATVIAVRAATPAELATGRPVAALSRGASTPVSAGSPPEPRPPTPRPNPSTP